MHPWLSDITESGPISIVCYTYIVVYYSILWYITVYYGMLWYIMVYYSIFVVSLLVDRSKMKP